jgi:hypothetical protein
MEIKMQFIKVCGMPQEQLLGEIYSIKWIY